MFVSITYGVQALQTTIILSVTALEFACFIYSEVMVIPGRNTDHRQIVRYPIVVFEDVVVAAGRITSATYLVVLIAL